MRVLVGYLDVVREQDSMFRAQVPKSKLSTESEHKILDVEAIHTPHLGTLDPSGLLAEQKLRTRRAVKLDGFSARTTSSAAFWGLQRAPRVHAPLKVVLRA